jgi:hypothetical protein
MMRVKLMMALSKRTRDSAMGIELRKITNTWFTLLPLPEFWGKNDHPSAKSSTSSAQEEKDFKSNNK